jgi:hypothetical protein
VGAGAWGLRGGRSSLKTFAKHGLKVGARAIPDIDVGVAGYGAADGLRSDACKQ